MTKIKMIKATLSALTFFPISLLASDLSVTNNINEKITRYSIEQLENLPTEKMTTVTPWREQEDVYDGIYLNDLVKMSGYDVQNISGIKVTALNDYAVEIPQASLLDKQYFVTFKRNGKRISVRQKGPITLILNFTDKSQGNNLLDIAYDQVWFVSDFKIIK
ncbi:hypothetical protein [Vibrio sp. 99-70-13A1]|uniref:hypothetical protein n=1 Tax=Vibrio sp. 99-70-13A1 TaxID=2607601 RepID=UPI0014936B07|nr:hypothetical protein [Vibrio sp. 99-70-13A1]NOH97547.1 hypothetical protein [Vibrio sp. 99-70-13A1]